jgi:N-acetyl-beta-hexosaminidase
MGCFTVHKMKNAANLNSGLQTFSQMVDWTGDDNYVISHIPFVINDAPRFPWRGLLFISSKADLQ